MPAGMSRSVDVRAVRQAAAVWFVLCGLAACRPVEEAPDPESVSCGGFSGKACPGGGRCADDPNDDCDPLQGGADCAGLCSCIETVLCVQGDVFDSSPSVCACVPAASSDPCAAVRCKAGTHCDADSGVAQCLPDPISVTCGGIAAFPCPGGGTCVDAPGDGCDPKHGGADCGGICTCVETVACTRDDVFDSSPSVCACVPSQVESPCALVDCQPGARCVVTDGAASCVSDGSLRCGPSTCAAGTTCCNASCGTCTAPGFACTDLFCEPKP